MLYSFNILEDRLPEYANYWCYDQPYIHPTRTLDVHDLIFMIEGEWEIGLDKEVYKMQANDVLILPAYIQHLGIKPCTPKTKYMYLHIYPSLDDKIYKEGEDITGSLLLNNFINTAENPNIKSLFEKIVKTRDNPSISSAYIKVLLYELSELSSSQTRSTLAQSIRNYSVSLIKIPTNDEIARHFHVSKRTAETIFKKQYQTTIHEYILKHKLEEGKRYLTDFPNMKLHTLAEVLGFYDEYHFSRMFKKHFGISPKDFKKQ